MPVDLADVFAVRLSTGVAVAVTGKWAPSQGQEQSHELQVEEIRILGENDATVSLSISSEGPLVQDLIVPPPF